MFGDGTKWICNWKELAAKRDCIIYSFGGNTNTQFEQAIRSTTRCDVHTFDLDCFEMCWFGPCYAGPRLTCHKVRIGPKDDAKTTPPTISLPSIMRNLSHKHIDILKIDIEGAEHAMFRALSGRFDWSVVGQLLMETPQGVKGEEETMLRGVVGSAHGRFSAFHSESNVYHGGGSREVGFVQDGSPGGAPTAADASLALQHADELALQPSRVAECATLCSQQPWRVGCRMSARRAGFGGLGDAYLMRFERACVIPETAKYLVLYFPGGGFGNQLQPFVSFAMAALLTDRILVVFSRIGAGGEA